MTKEELKLIEEMKDNCIKQANYVDPKAMEKYNALRNLLEENKELKEKQNYDLKWALKYDELYKENRQKEFSKYIELISKFKANDILEFIKLGDDK